MGEFRVLTSEWEDLLEALDYHLGGKIAYTQFITAAVNRAHLLSKNNLDTAFHIFDVDGNGFITISELRKIFENPTVVHENHKEN